jgi:molecular chaperone GrpE
LTPDQVPSVLGDFQRWLEELASAPEKAAPDEPAPAEEVDLATLLGQMIAVRQETNLLTRAARNQQEQSQETLAQLSSAVQMLQRSQAAANQHHEKDLEEQVRPVLRTLVDLYEILSLSSEQIQRTREAVLPELEALMERTSRDEPASLPPPPQEAPRRWFSFRRRQPAEDPAAKQFRQMIVEERRFHTETQSQTRKAVENLHAILSSLADGYRLTLQRLRRALEQYELEPMTVVGERFDPELMEVIDVVSEGDHEPGEVVEEVSRGYLWRGRVFRYAKVRVAKLGA